MDPQNNRNWYIIRRNHTGENVIFLTITKGRRSRHIRFRLNRNQSNATERLFNTSGKDKGENNKTVTKC